MFLDRVLHEEAWVAKILGTHLSVQVHKKVKFSRRNNSTLVIKGVNKNIKIVKKSHNFHIFWYSLNKNIKIVKWSHNFHTFW